MDTLRVMPVTGLHVSTSAAFPHYFLFFSCFLFFLPLAQYRPNPSHSHTLRSSDVTLAVAHEGFNLSFELDFKAAAQITLDIFYFARGIEV